MNRIVIRSLAAALALAAPAAAFAEPAAVSSSKTVGALALESRGRATSPEDVRRQGGFATAGAVQWKPAEAGIQAGAAYGGTVGALALETRGRATSLGEVRREGGAITAGAVQWVSAQSRL